MAYDARTVANEFLRAAWQSGRTLTNMQLQKLVYIAHGYTLAILHDPLIGQNVEAWRYGPVIRDLYKALQMYGAGQVTDFIAQPSGETLSSTHRAIVDVVEEAYGRFTGPQLSTMTHKADTPWAKSYDPRSFWNSDPIPDGDIETYYVELLNERQAIGPA
ncbi:MAG TPA: type II toxin-antitoxin system antitoxin SocA domain-containing protein [Pyrinomonadaceae bacterium]|nr:type II toxin-antitoxin system antitoxin SocA domain-containing protein [Pyrinomonadaceae bacterium]